MSTPILRFLLTELFRENLSFSVSFYFLSKLEKISCYNNLNILIKNHMYTLNTIIFFDFKIICLVHIF